MLENTRFRMHKKLPGRRIQKSRRLLHQALISLVLEKKYESITVQQILDRAGVGRSTFYLHFENKDDVLLMGFEHLAEILRDYQKRHSAIADSPENVIGFSRMLFEHLYEHRSEWNRLSGSQAKVLVRQSIQEMISELINEKLKAESQKRKGAAPEIPFDVFVEFLASTFMSVAAWWLDSDNPTPPDAVDNIYRALVMPSIKSNFA
jgi:AcrR family transcriptional regulator